MHNIVESVTLGPGWEAFLNVEQYWRYGFALIAATISGAILAYHPIYRSRRPTMESLELAKTLIIYTVVGALIAVICSVNHSMAFVIFGIGGLMRFRTNLDDSKNTGHAIIGTLIGLCWGLELQLAAVLATLYFWLMIYFLERSQIMELQVGGVSISQMPESTQAYKEAFTENGCTVLSSSKNFKKSQMTFIYRRPKNVTLDQLAASVNKIDDNLRGTPDWPQ
jgi:hypothetical protein